MTDSSKRVFLSYRDSIARAEARNLKYKLENRNFDVFLAPDNIGSGNFENVIYSQIKSREHFILLLVSGTLDRCNFDEVIDKRMGPNPDDWVRKEIEFALKEERNIIPLLVDHYEWRLVEPHLTGNMADIKKVNCAYLYTSHEKFIDTSIEILCDQYLTQSALGESENPSPENSKLAEELAESIDREENNHNQLEAERQLAEGNTAEQNKDWLRAIEKYTVAHELRPNWHIPIYNRGSALLKLGEFEKAIDDLTLAIELKSDFTEAITNLGVAYGDSGQLEMALSEFDEVIKLKPDHPLGYINRGIVNAQFDNFDHALKDLTKAIDLLDTNEFATYLAYFNRGVVYNDMLDYSSAISDFTESIRLNPAYRGAYNNRGISYGSIGNYAAAISDFSIAIELDKLDASGYTNRGRAYDHLRKYNEAIADFTSALHIDPRNFNAFLNRGVTYYNLGQYEHALLDYMAALELNASPGIYINVAEINICLRQFAIAKQMYLRSRALAKEHHEDFESEITIAGLAITHHALGEITEAHTLWWRLVEKDARHMDADWVGKEYSWTEPLIEEARKLIASLKDADD